MQAGALITQLIYALSSSVDVLLDQRLLSSTAFIKVYIDSVLAVSGRFVTGDRTQCIHLPVQLLEAI